MEPTNGIFVERRLLALQAKSDVQATVVAPVPWFPFSGSVYGRYGRFAQVTTSEKRHGVDIYHPRYPLIPKIGMRSTPFLMARAMLSVIDRVIAAHGPFQLLDAHYFYPDGVAAATIARRFGIPLLITARGSDVNLIGRYRHPRKAMVQAADVACGLIAVSRGLAKAMASMGMPDRKIHVLRNGVDLDFFSPGDRAAARKLLGIRDVLFISVGTLKPEKGHDVAVRLLTKVQNATLAVIGSGAEQGALRRLAQNLGVYNRVRFTGRLDPKELRTYYRAADASLLMSVREGMPNVVLESMACGTPVIATDVGGVPEIVEHGVTGRLVSRRALASLHGAWNKMVHSPIDRCTVRRHAETFSWDETVTGLYELMRHCAS